ncbi:copper amine oxidase N-terminal domain-containing protein [bacterium LRH843]|nr:copper amine oxidase N-terminal domain-containing protein [bacterium LRH843]
MKRLIVWMMLVACIAIGATPLQAAAASSDVKINIDGKPLNLKNTPAAFLENNRTLVPVRGVFEQLGLDVAWDQASKTATIKGEDVVIKMKPGNKQVTVNGKTETIDVPVKEKQDRLFIPLRFVTEKAGLEVHWNKANNTISIKTPLPGEEVADPKAFLEKLIAANEKLNSYSADLTVDQMMEFDGEKMQMDMDMKMDVVMNPLGLYQVMTMSLAELGEEDLVSKSYVTKDGFYTYDSFSDQWIKYDDDFFTDLIGLSEAQMDPTVQFELMDKYIENLKVYEQDNTYEMHFDVSGDGFKEMLDLILNAPELGLDEELLAELNMDIKINKMSIVTTLDKETLFPVADKMHSDMTIGVEGEEMRIVQKMKSSYSNYNKLTEIVVPKEVIDSAISFDEYMEQMEAEFAEAS